MQRLVFLAFFMSITTLAVIDFLAVELSLFWVYRWLDIPMHMLGGATVALGYQSRFMLQRWIARLSFTLPATIIVVMMVGVSWEIFEYAVGAVVPFGYVFDTVKDLTDDFIGSILGYYVARSLIRLQNFL